MVYGTAIILSELISHYLPSRSLRSSDTNLTRPLHITSNFASLRGLFLCLHLPLGTLYLHTFVLSTPYPLLNATQNSISYLYHLVIQNGAGNHVSGWLQLLEISWNSVDAPGKFYNCKLFAIQFLHVGRFLGPAPWIRSHDFWRCINLFVCVWVCNTVWCVCYSGYAVQPPSHVGEGDPSPAEAGRHHQRPRRGPRLQTDTVRTRQAGRLFHADCGRPRSDSHRHRRLRLRRRTLHLLRRPGTYW